MLRTSRFQFVDSAGNERLKDAQRQPANITNSKAACDGMMTIFSWIMLGQCVRELVASRRKRAAFSFRAFLFGLVLLLQESLVPTLVVMCSSSTPANQKTSKLTLDFGKDFQPPHNISSWWHLESDTLVGYYIAIGRIIVLPYTLIHAIRASTTLDTSTTRS